MIAFGRPSGRSTAPRSPVPGGRRGPGPTTTPVTSSSARSQASARPAIETPRVAASRFERFERVEDAIGGVALVRLGPQRHPRPGGRRFAAPVLARQPAARERAERRVAEPVLAADREDVVAIALLEQREAVLHPLVAREPLELGQLDRLRELLAAEVRGADRADLARPDDVAERLQRLLLRRVGVEVVREVEADPLDPEALQARVDLPVDPRATEAVIARPRPSG